MSKFGRVLLSIIQAVLSLVVVVFCVNAILYCSEYNEKINFISCIVRVLCIGLFAIFYYHSLVSVFSSETIFIPIHLIFSITAEVRILDTFARMFHLYLIPPVLIVNVFMFSTFMGILSIIGYCLFSSDTSKGNANLFLISALVVSFIFTILLPKPQNYIYMDNFFVFKIIVYVLYAVAIFSCFMLYLSAPPEGSSLRYVILILLVITNYINLFYDTLIMNVVGTALSLLASVLMIIMTNLNIVRF